MIRIEINSSDIKILLKIIAPKSEVGQNLSKANITGDLSISVPIDMNMIDIELAIKS